MTSAGFHEGINLSRLGSVPEGGRVLDYGCGQGGVSRFLLSRGFRVVAADIDPCCEHSIREGVTAQQNARLEFVLLDPDVPLPCDNGPFNAIICREVLEHVPDPEAVVRALGALLADGGLLVLSVPSYWSERYFSFWDPNWLAKSEHLRIFTRTDIVTLLTRNRLEEVAAEGQSFRWSLFWGMLAPFRVKHRMGNPQGHRRLVGAAFKVADTVCSLAGVASLGNRLLPKSYFHYAVKRKPRVLVVYDYPDWVLGHWAEEIRKLHGKEFDIVTMSMYQAGGDAEYAAGLVGKMDIVHLLLPHAHDLLRDLLRGKAVVGTMHHWVEWSEAYARAVEEADHVVTPSWQWKERLVEKGVGPRRITVVHGGVDDTFFQDGPSLLHDSLKLTCGFFAKMDSNEKDRKGTRHLLRLVDRIAEAGVADRFRLVISGPGWEEQVAAIRGKGVESLYFPYVPEKEMAALYRSLDVYLMLSDVEGGPVTIAEAMASGCLIFSTPVGVAMEFLQDRVTGRLVETSDPDSIMRMLLECHAAPDAREAITSQARRFALENLRYERTMLPLAGLYRELLVLVQTPGKGTLDPELETRATWAYAARFRVEGQAGKP